MKYSLANFEPSRYFETVFVFNYHICILYSITLIKYKSYLEIIWNKLVYVS